MHGVAKLLDGNAKVADGDGACQQCDVEGLGRADLLNERGVVDEQAAGNGLLQVLQEGLGAVDLARECRRHRLNAARGAHQGAAGAQVVQATYGFRGLKGDDEVCLAVGNKRRVDARLALVCQAHVRHDGAATLCHADGLGGAHTPIADLGGLCKQFGGKDGALTAHAGNHDVEH